MANSPLQVQVTFLQTATHSTTHTAPEHMKAFYKTFDEIKNERFDGMIITGAPIEDLDYEDVDYWEELCRIMDYTKENVYSTIHLCWGALAGLYYHFGIPKVHLDKKCSACSSTASPGPPIRWCAVLTRFLRPAQPLGRAGPRRHRCLRRFTHFGRK